jgi:hypothetical protein
VDEAGDSVGPIEAGHRHVSPFLGRRLSGAEEQGFVYAVTAREDHDATTLSGSRRRDRRARHQSNESGEDVEGWRDILAWASSGMAYLTRTAYPERGERLPRFPVDPQASVLAGTVAALAVCAAEYSARRSASSAEHRGRPPGGAHR